MQGSRRLGATRGWARVALVMALFVAVTLVAAAAEAQQILAQRPQQHDKVRLSGFLWRAKPNGVINFQALSEIPNLQGGVDFVDTLGLTDSDNGWIFEANVAAGRRHRFLLEYSRLENSGEAAINLTGIGIPLLDLIVAAQTALDFRELHAYYNFLFVASPQVEFGTLLGVGYFDVAASVTSVPATVAVRVDQAFPTFGANILINPKGPVRGYFEITGFPRITIEDLSGWQMDLVARLEVFVVRSFGVMIGYRRYRLGFDHASANIGFDTKWDGFTFGGQLRF